MANKNFWSCGLDVEYENDTPKITNVVNTSRWNDIARDYPSHMINYTDPQGVTYAVGRTSEADVSADWTGRSYATSTTCRAITPASCEWTKEWTTSPTTQDSLPLSAFNCSSAHAGLTGNFTSYNHLTRLKDWHQYLPTQPPFDNRLRPKLAPSKEILRVAKDATINDTQKMFKNPFTWVSHFVLAHREDPSWIQKIEKDNAAFK